LQMAWIRRIRGWLVGWFRPREDAPGFTQDADFGPTIGVQVVAEDRWLNPPRG
jgi:hypothetical protein